MGVATLNGHRVTTARASIPAWGRWFADVSIDGEQALTGAAELKIADLTLKGTFLSGGAATGRSHFRIVGGAGGWGRDLPRKSYSNDAGVKLATVLGDAATAVGETLDLGARSADRVGPSWAGEAGPACRLLELTAAGAWYIDEAGVTRLGRRPSSSLKAAATHGPVDKARGTVTLAAESIATILPGIVVDGLEAVDVEHEVTPEGLRSRIWGKHGSGASRRVDALQRIVEQLDPFRKYRGCYEYRVVTRSGSRLDLQPVRVSTGMPDLRRVIVRPGVAGCEAEVALGSRVIVGFVDADPSRPAVLGFEDAEGEGFAPLSLSIEATTFITLADGSQGVARVGDAVSVNVVTTCPAGAGTGTGTGTITAGSLKVRCG